mmetsp:Transcript_2691/g.7429  ORF Transcript_2691/g.7429 Transcript_2691/m.7429 type:complete len:218 (-) Transcript_2691:549-1202(-)
MLVDDVSNSATRTTSIDGCIATCQNVAMDALGKLAMASHMPTMWNSTTPGSLIGRVMLMRSGRQSRIVVLLDVDEDIDDGATAAAAVVFVFVVDTDDDNDDAKLDVEGMRLVFDCIESGVMGCFACFDDAAAFDVRMVVLCGSSFASGCCFMATAAPSAMSLLVPLRVERDASIKSFCSCSSCWCSSSWSLVLLPSWRFMRKPMPSLWLRGETSLCD